MEFLLEKQLGSLYGMLSEVDELTAFTAEEREKIRTELKKKFFDALENTKATDVVY